MDQGTPITQVSEIKSIQVEKITATPMTIEETKTVTTVIENKPEAEKLIPEKKIETRITESNITENTNKKSPEIPKEVKPEININTIPIQEKKEENKIKPKEEIKKTSIIHQEINPSIKDNEPVFQTKIIKEIPKVVEIKQDTPKIINQKEIKLSNPEQIPPKSISKDRVIPVGIIEANKSKVEIVDSPVEIIADEKLNNKNDIIQINKEKEKEKEKLISLDSINKEKKDINLTDLKEKLIPLELLDAKEPINGQNKMEIEEVHNKISITSKDIDKNLSQNTQRMILDLTKEKTIPLNPQKQTTVTNITNIISKEKEIPLPMKEHPKEKIISLDFKEIIKNAELPPRIKEAYNKILEHPKKKVENELITEILEGKKTETVENPPKEKQEKIIEKERKDNRNVNNIINQILQEKTVYPVKNPELNRMNNLNMNMNMNNMNNTNIISNNNTYIREERRDKRDKKAINRNEQILDILQGKLINIPSDNNVETIYEDRNDNIFKKKNNVQRFFDRKVVNNNTNNFNNMNYNNNMTMMDNNTRYLNIPGNYTNPEPNRMNYPRNYQNIMEINKIPENQNGRILIEKMDKVEIIEDKDENGKLPKNLQITEYPRMPRMVRKEQKRTEINILDPSLHKNEEIHILDTVNRNIDLFPHAQMAPPMQTPIPIPTVMNPKNTEVEKNEEKITKKVEYDFLKQFGKQKDDNSKELLDLIQTVIEDDPNQIKMFQQKIKDDEIKSGKKIETPIEEEEDEADLKAIENYKKKVQFNVTEFRKNRKPLNINKLLDNKKKNISIAEKRFNLMKDNALNKTNNPTTNITEDQGGVIELLDNPEAPLKTNPRGRRKRGPEKKNQDDEYKLEEDKNIQNEEEDLNIMGNIDNNELKDLQNDNKNKKINNIKSLVNAPTEEEMELVNNIARGRRNKKRTNPIKANIKVDENGVVMLDDDDENEENQENPAVPKPEKKGGKKRKGKARKPKEVMEINLGGDSDVGATNEETNDIMESNTNTNTNINNLGEVNEINEISDDNNNKEEIHNNLNNITNITNLNTQTPTNLGLGLDNMNQKTIPIYNPSAAFSNNIAINISKNDIISNDNKTTNIPNISNISNPQPITPLTAMPPIPTVPGGDQKIFISSLLSTLINHYGYETLVSCVIHRQKSNNKKLDDFIDFLLNNNTYSDLISCLINCKNEQDKLNNQTLVKNKKPITTPLKTRKMLQMNKENIMDLNNNITTSSLLNKKRQKNDDIEVIGLDNDNTNTNNNNTNININIPLKKRKKNTRWGNNKQRNQKKTMNNNNIVSLDDDEEEDNLKINLDDNIEETIPKTKKNNNTYEKVFDLSATEYGDHYHKGKDGLVFRYVFNSVQNDNMIVYSCAEEKCQSKALLKIKEQEFVILSEHMNPYRHKDVINGILEDKNVKLMNKKGYQDIQISGDNQREIEWAK
jgi:hypothetical protein